MRPLVLSDEAHLPLGSTDGARWKRRLSHRRALEDSELSHTTMEQPLAWTGPAPDEEVVGWKSSSRINIDACLPVLDLVTFAGCETTADQNNRHV